MDQPRTLERALAYHCAPALAGIKAADLFTWPNAAWGEVERYAGALARRGIRLRALRRGARRTLLLVYRPACLERCLSCPRVRALLEQAGYPAEGGAEVLLARLMERLEGEAFPHEIGLFLGYPPEDVEGFCSYQGQNYKLSGRWKVYGDREAASLRFQRYDHCRDALCRRLAVCPLLEVFHPVKGQEEAIH